MFTVMRRAGSASPEAISAARTRSRASETALSGRPTTLNAGMPGATCTCTSTARASIPSNATVDTRCTMRAPGRGPKVAQSCGRLQEHLQNKQECARLGVPEPARRRTMIDPTEIKAELSCARAARAALEAAESEIEGLVGDMRSTAWPRIALVDALLDDTYDPHLFARAN